jgi:uncharacterized DUF497 family protein
MKVCIMENVKFEWDIDKAAENEIKHGVSFEDARQVFFDEQAFDVYDEAHSINEERYLIIGLTGKGLITVCYTPRANGVIRLISAWYATEREERLHEGEE